MPGLHFAVLDSPGFFIVCTGFSFDMNDPTGNFINTLFAKYAKGKTLPEKLEFMNDLIEVYSMGYKNGSNFVYENFLNDSEPSQEK
jgi:hypothetical protein